MRTAHVRGACLRGAGAELVTVEARFEDGPGKRCELALSGLPDAVIRESRGRLACALAGAGLSLPAGRLHVNLLPAALPKRGELLDLPMALACAAAVGHFEADRLGQALFVGELGIDGRLHAVPGGLAVAEAGLRAGIARLVAPARTAHEAAHLPGTRVFTAGSLGEALRVAANPEATALAPPACANPARGGTALARVRGQRLGKHALCVAAAGGHGLLFSGPPGTGKSLLARALPELMPAPILAERIEITRVLSAAGAWPGGLAIQRPFRAPHHTTSDAGLVGGGNPPVAGEITLAHRGVLFLDELPEFRREALEALRQPLETGTITVSRAGERLEMPARFQLVAARNPCPCGYRGAEPGRCRCSTQQIDRYMRRLSGPLLDRIDLRIELGAPSLDELAGDGADGGPAADELLARVERAQRRARERQAELTNAQLDADSLDRVCPLGRDARRMLENARVRFGLSARALQSLRRVARTVADLEQSREVSVGHLGQAVALRG